MLRFIKKIFADEPKLKENVDSSDLAHWFDAKLKPIMAEFDSNINKIIQKIKVEKEITLANLKKLESAELHNKNVPLRALQFMEGNRVAYIKKVESFIRQISIEDEFNYKDYQGISRYLADFDSHLENFGKSTIKAFQVLQEFFANESREVAYNIRNFDIYIKELKQLFKAQKLEEIKELKVNIARFNRNIELKKELESEYSDCIKRYDSLKEIIEHKKNEIHRIKESDPYNHFIKLRLKVNELEKAIHDNDSAFLHSFSVIESSLKKYSRIALDNGNLIEKYQNDPINAVIEDKGFVILEILQKLSGLIKEDKLDLKDRKKERAIEEIKMMDKPYFLRYINCKNQLSSSLDKINDEISNNETNQSLSDKEKENDDLKNEEHELHKKIGVLKKDIETIDIKNMRDALVENIRTFTQIDVAITIP